MSIIPLYIFCFSIVSAVISWYNQIKRLDSVKLVQNTNEIATHFSVLPNLNLLFKTPTFLQEKD